MKKLFAFFSCFFLSTAVSAQAKPSDEEFCTMAPVEMLAALDGNWRLKPGPGVVMAGLGAFPLPAQGVQKLSFTYNSDSASVTIVDAKTGDDFILVPTTPEAAAGAFAPVAGRAAWPKAPRCWWTRFYRINRCASGCSAYHSHCVFCLPAVPPSWAVCWASSTAPLPRI